MESNLIRLNYWHCSIKSNVKTFNKSRLGSVYVGVNKIQKVVMKDDYTKVEISKQDITSSKELAGAKLTIFDKDGKEGWKWTDGEMTRDDENTKNIQYRGFRSIFCKYNANTLTKTIYTW